MFNQKFLNEYLVGKIFDKQGLIRSHTTDFNSYFLV